MKQFRIVSLSSQGKFVVQDSLGNNLMYPIEGFKVNPSNEFRHHFNDFIGKTIDCTLNKNATHIRYQNQAFLMEKLGVGALEVVQKELDESKIYSNDLKSRLMKVARKEKGEEVRVVDLTANRKNILKYFPRQEEVVGELEYFAQEIVMSVRKDKELIYLPFKLKNINTMFSCLEESVFAPFFIDNKKIKVRMQRPFYNLVQKRFQINAQLDPQLELTILKNGWGIVNSSMIVTNSKDINPQEYLQAEAASKEKHEGIFSKNTEILGFIYAKNNFVGEVSDIYDGYVFQVSRKGSEEKLKIELAMVRSPVGDETGAFNSREFARKQLIGQQVNVYLHKDSGLNITGSLVRLKDSKDVETLMVEQGWGFVREEFVNSILCMKLNDLEKKAKQKLRGLHSKDIGVFRPQDLTVPNTQKQEFYYYRREEVLKKLGESEVGVLQGMFDAVSYRVWLQDKNIILKVRLQGVLGNNINPLLEEVKAMKEELRVLYQKKMKKRSITVNITQYSKEGNYFVGTINFIGGRVLQEILLESSFVYADKENAKQAYRSLEDKAREGKRGVWSANLVNFQPINPLDLQGKSFKGKFSWIEDGETVFVQPESNYKTLDKIFNELASSKTKKVPKEQLVSGALYAAPYFGDLYRALILSIKGKKVKVLFIDWGNKETVDEESLWELPESLKFIERQALKAKLHLARATKNEEHLQRLRGELISGEEYVFKKEKGQFISAFRNKERTREREHNPGRRTNERNDNKDRKKFTEKSSGGVGVERRGKQK